MLNEKERALVLRYRPYICRDAAEPFPIRFVGCTVFAEPGRSQSFPKWIIDPQAEGLAMIIEYAIYYDYDIQHLYDLEHIWVGVNEDGCAADCWCSFHGMRLRAAGIPSFRMEEDHPVLYAQPGKHAMLPSPELFELHPQFHTACNAESGGGLLIPPMLAGDISVDAVQNEKIRQYIRSHFSFKPVLKYIPETLHEDQYISWQELLAAIPVLIAEQLRIIN